MKTVHDAVLVDTNAHRALIRQPVATAKVIRVDDLRIPIHIALGRLEAATDLEIHELIADLTHERDRRVS